jgi:MoxR-like ATPase
LLAASRAWAFIDGRDAALPEDVQAVFGSVAAHRLRLAQGNGHASADELAALIRRTPLP